MADASLTPDFAWTIGTVAAAALTAAPAYLSARRMRREEAQGRQSMSGSIAHEFGRLHGRLDAQDKQLGEISEWQAEHTTEHAVAALTRSSRLEIRRKDQT